MSPFKIQPATNNDIPELCALVNSAYRGESSKTGWTTEAEILDGQRTDPQSLAALIAKPKHTILCLRDTTSQELLACILLELFSDHHGDGCYLGMLTVKPTLQSQGLGHTLLCEAENLAQSWGARRMTLNVIQLRHTLIAWYVRHGYRPTGETRPFPYGQPEFGIPKRADLHFVMFEKQLPL